MQITTYRVLSSKLYVRIEAIIGIEGQGLTLHEALRQIGTPTQQ
jgi:hypothetical protein